MRPNGGDLKTGWIYLRSIVPTLRRLAAITESASIVLLASVLGTAQQPPQSQATKPAPLPRPEIKLGQIPRLETAPRLSDFEGMAPATPLARQMLMVNKFVQRDPKDGAPVSQRTEAYLGYTNKDFYVLFLAFDTEPEKMRARMLRRELIDDDDQIGFFLDTFHDQRHAYEFYANPYGISRTPCSARARGRTNPGTPCGTLTRRSPDTATWCW